MKHNRSELEERYERMKTQKTIEVDVDNGIASLVSRSHFNSKNKGFWDKSPSQEKILEIIQSNYNKHKGTNEAELHASEEIADLIKVNTAERLILIVSEISEAMEADRKDHYSICGSLTNAIKEAVNGIPEEDRTEEVLTNLYKELFERHVKNTFEDELADAVIRIFDLCGSKNIDIAWHIAAKMKYNSTRPYKHGVKY